MQGPLVCVECDALATKYCIDCDDCFCVEHFAALHRKGKRSAHCSETFLEHSMHCVQCENRPAVRRCTTCDEWFCDPCGSSTHAKGRRREHKWVPADVLPTMVNPALNRALLADGGDDDAGAEESKAE